MKFRHNRLPLSEARALGLASVRLYAGMLALLVAVAPARAAPTVHGELVDGQPFHWLSRDPSWSGVVVFSDTHCGVGPASLQFKRRMHWTLNNKDSLRLGYVIHAGDIVHDGTWLQWTEASELFGMLDRARVPYSVIAGNHDYGTQALPSQDPRTSKGKRRTCALSKYFPVERLAEHRGMLYLLGDEGSVGNSIREVQAPDGKPWLIVGMEIAPRKEIVEAAADFIAQNKTKPVILVTHTYLTPGGGLWKMRQNKTSRSKNNGFPGHNPEGLGLRPHHLGHVYDGQRLWRDLVNKLDNIVLVVSGHYGQQVHNVRQRHTAHRTKREDSSVVEMMARRQYWASRDRVDVIYFSGVEGVLSRASYPLTEGRLSSPAEGWGEAHVMTHAFPQRQKELFKAARTPHRRTEPRRAEERR